MKYFGLQQQIRRNNSNSVIVLLLFTVIFLGLAWLLFFITSATHGKWPSISTVNFGFFRFAPFIGIGITIWFTIAWFAHAPLINSAARSRQLTRKENRRVYNLVENLCIAAGMAMPGIRIIDEDSLNAFASGLNVRTFSLSLSRGIIEKLDDDELDAVIAHELAHIKNRDVRLLIISIVFVGIFAFISEAIFRSVRFGRPVHQRKGGGGIIVIALILGTIGYLFSSVLKFALSGNREYLADAGSAELTRRPYALASALRKVSADPAIEAVRRRDVAQLFIDNPGAPHSKRLFSLASLFDSHPPIGKRIELLEQS